MNKLKPVNVVLEYVYRIKGEEKSRVQKLKEVFEAVSNYLQTFECDIYWSSLNIKKQLICATLPREDWEEVCSNLAMVGVRVKHLEEIGEG